MIAGLYHTAEKGRYPFMLALICGILVYQYGMFEGLVIVIAVHAFIFFVVERYKNTPTSHIIKTGLKLFSDQPEHRSTPTMDVMQDPHTGIKTYKSIKRNPTDKISLVSFLKDWGEAVNRHSVMDTVSHYDAQAMLWGTFAQKLNSGHDAIVHYFEHLLTLPKVRVDFESFDFRQYGDIFIQSGVYSFSYEKKGQRITIPARYSFVCKKERTGWYILEHHSSEFPS